MNSSGKETKEVRWTCTLRIELLFITRMHAGVTTGAPGARSKAARPNGRCSATTTATIFMAAEVPRQSTRWCTWGSTPARPTIPWRRRSSSRPPPPPPSLLHQLAALVVLAPAPPPAGPRHRLLRRRCRSWRISPDQSGHRCTLPRRMVGRLTTSCFCS